MADKIDLVQDSAAEGFNVFAKKILICLFAVIMMALLPVSLFSCEANGTIDTEKYEYDKYGHVRPKNVWITDSMILPGILPQSELFGTLGESGILSEYALENRGALKPGETNYFVTMCYGTPGVERLGTYLRFVLVGEDGIFFDDECVTVGKPLKYGIDIESFDMSKNPGSRLRLRFGQNVQGAIVIPFTLKEGMEGILSAHCVAEVQNPGVEHYVSSEAQARVGEVADAPSVRIDDISISYMSESAYKAGDYSDAAIRKEPIFEDGRPCYMMLDVSFTPTVDNEGELSVGCCTVMHSGGASAVTVESATTGKIEESIKNGAYEVRMLYGVPRVAGEEKKASMMLRLESEESLKKQMEIFVYGAEGMPLSGTTLIRDVFGASEFLDDPFVPGSDGDPVDERYMPAWLLILILAVSAVIILIVCIAVIKKNILISLTDYIPVLTLAVISLCAVAELVFLTELSWWIVSVCITVIIAAMAVCVCSHYAFHENLSVGMLCVTAPAVAFISALRQWAVLEVIAAAMISVALFVFIGYVTLINIKKRSGEAALIFASVLASFAITVMLIMFSELAWWKISIVSAVAVLLTSLIISSKSYFAEK